MRLCRRVLQYEDLETRLLLTIDHFPSEPRVLPGNQASVPVIIDDAAGLRAVEIHLRYQPTDLSIDLQGIAAGPAWRGQGMVAARVDEDAGKIVAYIFSTEPLTSGPGELAAFHFRVEGDSCPVEPLVQVIDVRLNEATASIASPPPNGEPTTAADDLTAARQHAPDTGERGASILGTIPLSTLSDPLTIEQRKEALRPRPSEFVGPLPETWFAAIGVLV